MAEGATDSISEQPVTVQSLGIEEMDSTHNEFIELITVLATAKNGEFVRLFQQLFEHTREHFEREKQWMKASGFPAISEHTGEHNRILGELDRFNQKVSRGIFMFARAYIREQLPGWFQLHLGSMDSALATHMLKSGIIADTEH